MYKITRESKNGSSTTVTTNLKFVDAFDEFIELMNIHCIERFSSFGIPLDCDIETIGFGLMFHAENEWMDLTLTKTATGNECGSKFLKSINDSMENDLMKFLNE
jgi:hypothetical protein